MPADDRRIGADACPPSNRRRTEFVFPRNIGARIVHVREDAAGPAKHVVGEFDAIIDRDVVLDLAIVPDPDARTDHDVLPDRAILTDRGASKNMTKMPNPGAAADRGAIVDIARFMNQHAGKARILAHLTHRCIALWAKAWTPLLPTIGAVRNVETISIDVRTSSSPKPRPATISS
jgi:hypothetical protein